MEGEGGRQREREREREREKKKRDCERGREIVRESERFFLIFFIEIV